MNENVNKQKQYFIDLIAKYCDKCGKPYSISDVEIIKDTPISSIIHFSCNSCKANHIATFLKPMGICNRMPINTDLGIEEITKFSKKQEISTEDILDIYLYLKKSSSIKV